jgi:hypothetical protein
MRDRREPWKWPVCIGVTVAVFLGTAFLLPASWIRHFFSPLPLAVERTDRAARRWLVVLPPPELEPVGRHEQDPPPPARQPRRDFQDPRWWQEGWRIRQDDAATRLLAVAPTDSLEILLNVLGLEREFMMQARPDSILAAKLLLLAVEESFNFDELKPLWQGVARSRAYADILSRAADMYGEHLQSEIMVPD